MSTFHPPPTPPSQLVNPSPPPPLPPTLPPLPPPLHCIHSPSDLASVSPTLSEAVESFRQCLDKHVIPRAMQRLEQEEMELGKVEEEVAKLGRVELTLADELRVKVMRLAAVMKRVKVACRELGREEDAAAGE